METFFQFLYHLPGRIVGFWVTGGLDVFNTHGESYPGFCDVLPGVHELEVRHWVRHSLGETYPSTIRLSVKKNRARGMKCDRRSLSKNSTSEKVRKSMEGLPKQSSAYTTGLMVETRPRVYRFSEQLQWE